MNPRDLLAIFGVCGERVTERHLRDAREALSTMADAMASICERSANDLDLGARGEVVVMNGCRYLSREQCAMMAMQARSDAVAIRRTFAARAAQRRRLDSVRRGNDDRRHDDAKNASGGG